MKKLITLVIISTSLFNVVNANDVRFGKGYTVVDNAQPIDRSINQKIYFQCNKNTEHVFGILKSALAGTGYALGLVSESDERIMELYEQPAHRCMNHNDGLHTLSHLLQNIAGDGWILLEDPVRRKVTFRVNPKYAKKAYRTVKIKTPWQCVPTKEKARQTYAWFTFPVSDADWVESEDYE